MCRGLLRTCQHCISGAAPVTSNAFRRPFSGLRMRRNDSAGVGFVERCDPFKLSSFWPGGGAPEESLRRSGTAVMAPQRISSPASSESARTVTGAPGGRSAEGPFHERRRVRQPLFLPRPSSESSLRNSPACRRGSARKTKVFTPVSIRLFFTLPSVSNVPGTLEEGYRTVPGSRAWKDRSLR